MYEVVKVKGGYRVRKKGKKRYLTSPVPRERAFAQARAMMQSLKRVTKPASRKRYKSPIRSTKSPSRVTKPMSPKMRRVRKRQTTPKPKKRQTTPKRLRK